MSNKAAQPAAPVADATKTELQRITERYQEYATAGKYKGDTFNQLTVAITDSIAGPSSFVKEEDGSYSVKVDNGTDEKLTLMHFTQGADGKFTGLATYGTMKESLPQWVCKRLQKYCEGKGKRGGNSGAAKNNIAAAFGIKVAV